MSEEKKYYISVDGKKFEACRELYEAYTRGRCKDSYFTHDLKQERKRVDRKTGKVTVTPSREDSYERLLEAEQQFSVEAESVEGAAIRAVLLEKLNSALHILTKEEKAIIYTLYYMEASDTDLAKNMGIPRSTLVRRKEKILEKLRNNL